jgi:hypothetical protein
VSDRSSKDAWKEKTKREDLVARSGEVRHKIVRCNRRLWMSREKKVWWTFLFFYGVGRSPVQTTCKSFPKNFISTPTINPSPLHFLWYSNFTLYYIIFFQFFYFILFNFFGISAHPLHYGVPVWMFIPHHFAWVF